MDALKKFMGVSIDEALLEKLHEQRGQVPLSTFVEGLLRDANTKNEATISRLDEAIARMERMAVEVDKLKEQANKK